MQILDIYDQTIFFKTIFQCKFGLLYINKMKSTNKGIFRR